MPSLLSVTLRTLRDRLQQCQVLSGFRVSALLAALSVPATLRASLDRLGPAAKEIAQIGAVAGLLFCRGTAPHASYLFKHHPGLEKRPDELEHPFRCSRCLRCGCIRAFRFR